MWQDMHVQSSWRGYRRAVNKMPKQYRKRKKHIGTQTVHKSRQVHALDDVIPLDELREEMGAW